MRIPQSLKDALDAAATENKRSLTAEVVARLEQSFYVSGSGKVSMRMTSEDKNAYVADNHMPSTVDALAPQIRLELAIDALESQVKIAHKKIAKVKAAISAIEDSLAQAEEAGNNSQIRTLTSRLHEEQKWCRELDYEYESTKEELSELRKQLTAARTESDGRFALGA